VSAGDCKLRIDAMSHQLFRGGKRPGARTQGERDRARSDGCPDEWGGSPGVALMWQETEHCNYSTGVRIAPDCLLPQGSHEHSADPLARHLGTAEYRAALRQHVHLEAEVAAAADQVAQCSRAELVLGHRDRFVNDEGRAPWVR
jgi:hypothetical protein